MRHFGGTFARLATGVVDRLVGPEAVEAALRHAGETRGVGQLGDELTWSSYAQLRALLEACSVQLGGPERLVEAGADGSIIGGPPDTTAMARSRNTPYTTDMIQSLGGPGTIYKLLGEGHGIISTIMEHEAEEAGPTEWILRQRLVGFEPFVELCWLSMGMLAMSPRLFGHAAADVVEETCCRSGDAWCSFRIRWEEGDDPVRRARFFEDRARLFERRFESLERTVADLTSDGDLATVLPRVVESAARAVRVPAFVLAIEPLPGVDERVWTRGLDDAAAAEIAAELLRPERHERSDLMVAEVVSGSRHYGWLAAVDLDRIALPHEIVILRSYARLAASALDSATLVAEARSQEARAQALLSLSIALAEITTIDEMAANLARAIPAVTGADCAAVAFYDDDLQSPCVQATVGWPPAADAALTGLTLPAVIEGRSDQVRYQDGFDARSDIGAVMSATGTASVATVPVFVEGRFAGVIVAAVNDHPERLRPTPELEARLRGLAGQASTALRNARLMEQISHQARHDALTGLPNRSMVLDRAERLVRDAHSAALFIDLDGFKDVNDTLGHATGDELLRAVAARLRTAVRGSDTIARLGGDEFVVLTSSPLDGAQQVADRIIEVIAQPFHLPGMEATPISISASIGIATATHAADADAAMNAEGMLRDADIALYQAKADGKNRSVVFAPAM